ncbi:MAG: hypothetical protein LBQ46_01510, partial [Treponema sp.]|nr:hypothetical protein [Treponema sp.]
MFRRIKSKVLMVILCTSLGALLLLSLTGIVSIVFLRNAIPRQGREMGNLAARDSETAMRDQVHLQLMQLAQDRAALTDERLRVIQTQTESVANIASRIYTYKSRYR